MTRDARPIGATGRARRAEGRNFFGKHVATPSEVELITIRVDALRTLVRQLTGRVKRAETAHAELAERVRRGPRDGSNAQAECRKRHFVFIATDGVPGHLSAKGR